MHTLAVIARWEITILFSGFSAVIAAQLLTGRINTRRLFWGRRKNGTPYFSPERVQLLLFTLAAAFQIISQVLHNPRGVSLPEISDRWLVLLGSSHGVYLASKGYTMLNLSGKDRT
jgi:hypothetical protein